MRNPTPASLNQERVKRSQDYEIIDIISVSNIQQTTLRAIIFQQIRAIYLSNLPLDEEFRLLICHHHSANAT